MSTPDPPVPAPSVERASGFRPNSRRRTRIAAGVALAALAIGGNVVVYSSLDDSTGVVQFTTNIPAGDPIGPADVRIVQVDADLAATSLVPAARIDSIVGRYARTFIPARSLASDVLVRSTPLASPGAAVVAVAPSGDRVPSGLTERSRVRLVVDGDAGPAEVEARVVAIAGTDDDVVLSVEVAEADAPVVALADVVHVVLLDPGLDPAIEAIGTVGP